MVLEVEKGNLSASRAAEMLGVSIWDIFQFAERHGVRLGATVEQRRKSLTTAKKILK